jgi:hypothetical protein
MVDSKVIHESKTGEGYEWKPMASGGLLIIRREHGRKVILLN